MRNGLGAPPGLVSMCAALLMSGVAARAEADFKVEVSGLRNYKGQVVLELWAASDGDVSFSRSW